MVKRQWHAITVFIAFLLFSILTGLVFAGRTEAVDQAIYEFVFQFYAPWVTELAKILSFIGSARFIIGGLVLLLIIAQTRTRYGIWLAVTAGCAALLNSTMKDIFQRSRPTVNPLVVEKSFSYPSGHSMSNMALYTMLALLLITYLKGSRARIPAAAASIVMALLIGLSRIYLGVHYPSDVAGGFLMGFVIALTIYAVFFKTEKTG